MKPYFYFEEDTRLTRSVRPCTECGGQPKIRVIVSEFGTEYKFVCSESCFHNGAGCYFKNKAKAALDWNKRQKMADPDFEDMLNPCPFCGRKMKFYRDEHFNKYGRPVIHQYWMHEDSEARNKCVLDEIMSPFVIPAGDAVPEEKYIGEYGELWNKRVYKW